uniref:Uncharacterized protein n=1 Tax=Mycena chlorophos TaxID=658473 RepID=A0ABQ0LJB5_MYCCL|nr:predicted protein [Mycena chlorophos]
MRLRLSSKGDDTNWLSYSGTKCCCMHEVVWKARPTEISSVFTLTHCHPGADCPHRFGLPSTTELELELTVPVPTRNQRGPRTDIHQPSNTRNIFSAQTSARQLSTPNPIRHRHAHEPSAPQVWQNHGDGVFACSGTKRIERRVPSQGPNTADAGVCFSRLRHYSQPRGAAEHAAARPVSVEYIPHRRKWISSDRLLVADFHSTTPLDYKNTSRLAPSPFITSTTGANAYRRIANPARCGRRLQPRCTTPKAASGRKIPSFVYRLGAVASHTANHARDSVRCDKAPKRYNLTPYTSLRLVFDDLSREGYTAHVHSAPFHRSFAPDSSPNLDPAAPECTSAL